jgi:hypothetical protein
MSLEVEDALSAWDNAPLHVRAMAGQYVGPILAALAALQRDLNAVGLIVAEIKNERAVKHGS